MNALTLRSIARWAVLTFALSLALGWPWPSWRARASELFCAVVNVPLEQLTFGQGGHAKLRPRAVSEVRLPGENATSDAILRLSVDGYQGEVSFAVSLRRDFYLPLAIAFSVLVTAPLPLRRRSLALLLGGTLSLAWCFASLCLTSLLMFERLPAGRAFSEQLRLLINGIVGSLIMPPGVHFFVPILIAAASVWSLSEHAYGGSSRADEAVAL